MQNKNKVKRKTTTPSTISGIISIILFIIIIPALSLIKIQDENTTSFSIKFDMTSDNTTNYVLNNDTEVEKEVILPAGITSKDYNMNNFYLIQNYKTNEIITLTPFDHLSPNTQVSQVVQYLVMERLLLLSIYKGLQIKLLAVAQVAVALEIWVRKLKRLLYGSRSSNSRSGSSKR